jgi:hypothetical protein
MLCSGVLFHPIYISVIITLVSAQLGLLMSVLLGRFWLRKQIEKYFENDSRFELIDNALKKEGLMSNDFISRNEDCDLATNFANLAFWSYQLPVLDFFYISTIYVNLIVVGPSLSRYCDRESTWDNILQFCWLYYR